MLNNKISYLANKFQAYLFPIVKETLGEEELLQKHYRIIQILEIIQIERYLSLKPSGSRGRPSKHRYKVARALLAKHVLNLKTTAQLIHHLKVDKNLRYICGWEPGEKVADESVFSRVFQLLANSNVLEKIHEALAKECFSGHCVLHNGRDAVPIPAREWPYDKNGKKMRAKKGAKKGKKKYPHRDESVSKKQAREDLPVEEMVRGLPKLCDIGKKTNSSGKVFCWRGYKLHLDVAEGWFPLSCIITSASVHDTQAAIPLSKMSSERSIVLYELMDSAYDSEAIRNYIEERDRKPLISPRIWNGRRGEETKGELRARKTLSWKPSEAKRLGHRMANERLFSRLQDHFSGMGVWVRGYDKVKCHVMLGVLCLAADELLRHLC